MMDLATCKMLWVLKSGHQIRRITWQGSLCMCPACQGWLFQTRWLQMLPAHLQCDHPEFF